MLEKIEKRLKGIRQKARADENKTNSENFLLKGLIAQQDCILVLYLIGAA